MQNIMIQMNVYLFIVENLIIYTINIHHPNYIFIYNTDTEAQALNIEADILTNNNFLENHQLQNNKQE